MTLPIRFWLIYVLVALFFSPASLFAKTFIIDAGHGYQDKGAGADGVFEKHLTLDTARRVAFILRNQGYRVVMTRERDVFIPLPGRSALGNSEPDAIFCSIHYNFTELPDRNGIESYYFHPESQLLAAYVQAYLLQSTHAFNRGVKSASFHVIRETWRNPAILVEGGFVSNPQERARLCTGAYRQTIAESIARGLIAYTMAHG